MSKPTWLSASGRSTTSAFLFAVCSRPEFIGAVAARWAAFARTPPRRITLREVHMIASHHPSAGRPFNHVCRKRGPARSVIEPLESRLCLNVALPGVQTWAGDYNGDGKIDLLMTAVGRHQGLSLRLGNGDGTFGAA